jgi:hypothetical protein
MNLSPAFFCTGLVGVEVEDMAFSRAAQETMLRCAKAPRSEDGASGAGKPQDKRLRLAARLKRCP